MEKIISGMEKIEIQELSDEKIRFQISKIDVSIANSLRRILISEIPTMAVHLVKVRQNTTALPDEILAQRLGLIPLDSSLAHEFKYNKDCACIGTAECSECKAYLTLRVRCEGENDALEVTSRDLLPVREEDKRCAPIKVYDTVGEENGITIVKLRRNQEIHVDCEVRKGIGKIHAKFSPVSVANFQHIPVIKLNEKLNDFELDKKQEFIKSCPTNVYTINPNTQKIEIVDSDKCMYCGECEKKSEQIYGKSDGSRNIEQLVKITSVQDRFQFSVESTGVMKAEDIVRIAFERMVVKLNEIKSNLSIGTR